MIIVWNSVAERQANWIIIGFGWNGGVAGDFEAGGGVSGVFRPMYRPRRR